MSNSKHDGHITETPDVSYIKNVDVTHETSDVNVPGIVKFLVGLSVLTIVTFVLMWGLFRSLEKKVTEVPRSPILTLGFVSSIRFTRRSMSACSICSRRPMEQ